jgi:hypothetical protein
MAREPVDPIATINDGKTPAAGLAGNRYGQSP